MSEDFEILCYFDYEEILNKMGEVLNISREENLAEWNKLRAKVLASTNRARTQFPDHITKIGHLYKITSKAGYEALKRQINWENDKYYEFLHELKYSTEDYSSFCDFGELKSLIQQNERFKVQNEELNNQINDLKSKGEGSKVLVAPKHENNEVLIEGAKVFVKTFDKLVALIKEQGNPALIKEQGNPDLADFINNIANNVFPNKNDRIIISKMRKEMGV